jgi:hypothetical protein
LQPQISERGAAERSGLFQSSSLLLLAILNRLLACVQPPKRLLREATVKVAKIGRFRDWLVGGDHDVRLKKFTAVRRMMACLAKSDMSDQAPSRERPQT